MNELMSHQESNTSELLDRMEICSTNYNMLFEAMGSEKYKAFTYGDGLKSIPILQRDISQNGFKGASYSIGTFINENGSEESSLFVEQRLAESRVVYELETEKQKYLTFDIYKTKHLYVVGKGGVTVDLTEELPLGFDIYACPDEYFSRIQGSSVDPIHKRIILSDLSKYHLYKSDDVISARLNTGLPIILHEIGHAKHIGIEPDDNIVDNRALIIRVCGILGLTRDVLNRAVTEKNFFFLKPLLKVLEEYGSEVLKNETIASLWASRWMETKLLQGADFWKPENEEFWEQLDVALASYRVLLALNEAKKD